MVFFSRFAQRDRTAKDLRRVTTGIGFDTHCFGEGRRLILGGVEIPHSQGLVGHSDADVVTHAIIDALLGAAGLGDIGQHFPDTDERYRDADSMQLLKTITQLLGDEQRTVNNIDVTVILEEPKLGPYREQIRVSLATVLALDLGRVNIKATTAEKMGFLGRGEGVAAIATATLS